MPRGLAADDLRVTIGADRVLNARLPNGAPPVTAAPGTRSQCVELELLPLR